MIKRLLTAFKIARQAFTRAMDGTLDEEGLANVKKPSGGGGPGEERK